MTLFISIAVIFLTAAGQILLKMGADKPVGNRIFNGFVISGYLLFFLTIVLSYHLLKIIPMNHFVVIMSANYIAVMIASKVFLDEKINRDRMIGTALIAAGMFIFLYNPQIA
jgi:uncharacterized membrane protein